MNKNGTLKHISEIHPETGGVFTSQEWKPMAPKKPTREFCKRELWSRLALKKNAPNDFSDPKVVVLGRVIDVLFDASEDQEHTKRIIDACEQLEVFPDGYMIRQIATDTRATERRPHPECSKCGGTGFFSVETDEETCLGTQRITRAGKCDCWRVVERAGVRKAGHDA